MATKATKGSKAVAESNGRSRDILEDYTEAQRKALAKSIFRMKQEGAKWGDIGEELGLPGDRPSVAGRRLLREYHPSGESVIRERAAGSGRKAGTAAKTQAAKPKASAAKATAGKAKPATKPAARTKVVVKRGRGRQTNP